MSKPLEINELSAQYGKTTVLDRLSLTLAEGEFVSLLGASGCGKTTTLRVVAGFLQPSGGSVRLGGADLLAMPAHKRDIGLVFQNYALFPHLSVFDNVGFGLRQRGVAASECQTRVMRALDRVGLQGFATRYPGALSGGQKQRVALARALVIDPSLLMFDEPLSNLDARLRVGIRAEIRALQLQQGTTTVYVTHDQEEAFSISDRVAIMDAGRIRQLDTPQTLYSRPVDAFVARFVGFETLLPLRVVDRQGARVTVQGAADGLRWVLDEAAFGRVPDAFTLAARADGLAPGADGLPGRVRLRTFLGRAYQYHVDTALGLLVVNGPAERPFAPGDTMDVVPVPAECCLLPAGET
jgi:putative spermidine/putrescine transport system ATP-binding protein